MNYDGWMWPQWLNGIAMNKFDGMKICGQIMFKCRGWISMDKMRQLSQIDPNYI